MARFEDGCYGSLKGIALISKVLAGRCRMHYTRVAAGKGQIPDDLTPKTLTEPPGYVMDAQIASVTNPVDGECQVSVQLNSAFVKEGFYCTWLVLYAEDPDEGEVPYTALCLENEPEWIRPSSSIVGKLAHFDIIAAVGDVDCVSATIDPDALVTLESVIQLISEHGRDPETHQDIRQAVKALQDKLGGGVIRAEKLDLTISADRWEPDEDTGGLYPFHADVIHAKITEDMVPLLAIPFRSMAAAADCELCTTAQAFPGVLRVYAKSAAAADIDVSVTLLGDLRSSGELIIPTEGWVPDEDSGGMYALHIDITVEEAAEGLVPMLLIQPSSMLDAGNCGLCPSIETIDGAVRLYAKSVPAVPINAQLNLLETASSGGGNSAGSGPSYTLPIADSTTLGGVKVKRGSGLTIDGNGNLALDAAAGEDVVGLFTGSKAD